MARIPFGISRLDSMIGGGAPRGSVVLLAGESGAGAREFLYTSATMSAVLEADADLADLYYGESHPRSERPSGIHYVSFTSTEAAIREEMRYTMADELVDATDGEIDFFDLSESYFRQSPVPTAWYAARTPRIDSLGEYHDREDVLDALGAYLDAHGSDSLVAIDSLTDLVSVPDEELDWTDVTLLLKGLKRAATRWGGVILLLVNLDAIDEQGLGGLMEASDGSLLFRWETGGNERTRTMFVQQFRGVLSRLEEENIITFETEIHDGGFDITDVRKIR